MLVYVRCCGRTHSRDLACFIVLSALFSALVILLDGRADAARSWFVVFSVLLALTPDRSGSIVVDPRAGSTFMPTSANLRINFGSITAGAVDFEKSLEGIGTILLFTITWVALIFALSQTILEKHARGDSPYSRLVRAMSDDFAKAELKATSTVQPS
jgi:hypothetical protein